MVGCGAPRTRRAARRVRRAGRSLAEAESQNTRLLGAGQSPCPSIFFLQKNLPFSRRPSTPSSQVCSKVAVFHGTSPQSRCASPQSRVKLWVFLSVICTSRGRCHFQPGYRNVAQRPSIVSCIPLWNGVVGCQYFIRSNVPSKHGEGHGSMWAAEP